MEDYGTWASSHFGTHDNSWNQSPTNTEGQLYQWLGDLDNMLISLSVIRASTIWFWWGPSSWLANCHHLAVSSLRRERENTLLCSSSYKDRSPVMQAPPSWPHVILVISQRPTSKYHHNRCQGFNIWILRGYKCSVQKTENKYTLYDRESNRWLQRKAQQPNVRENLNCTS